MRKYFPRIKDISNMVIIFVQSKALPVHFVIDWVSHRLYDCRNVKEKNIKSVDISRILVAMTVNYPSNQKIYQYLIKCALLSF